MFNLTSVPCRSHASRDYNLLHKRQQRLYNAVSFAWNEW